MVYCAVYGCMSSNKSSEKTGFHRFPSNTAEAAKWLRFCRRADTVNLKNAAVCGLHFKPSDYRRNLQHELLNPGKPDNRPKLKHGAVPSVEPPECNTDGEVNLRIRKQYLHGDASSIRLQQEDKRCKDCGSVFGTATTLVSPMVMQNVRLENRSYNSNLLPFKFDFLEDRFEKNDSVRDFFSDNETTVDVLNHDYPRICLVCDVVIKDSSSVGVMDIYSESSVTSYTKQQLVVVLAVIVDISLNASKAYSRTLCQKCLKLLDELDEAQQRSAALKSSIENLYNRSLEKRNRAPKESDMIEEEFQIDNPSLENDHQLLRPLDDTKSIDDVQQLLCSDNMKTEERSSGPFDRIQWRKDEAVRDALRREGDPLYREAVRRGWRERKAKQRMKDIGNSEKQTDLSSEDVLMEVEQMVSNFESDQEPEIPKVIQISHSTGPINPTNNSYEAHGNHPKPVIIKVCKTTLPSTFVASELKTSQECKPKVKRQYRKRSDIIHLCKFCLKVFSTGEELKKHQKTHTTVECDYCGKVLVRIGAWENHLRAFHSIDIQNSGDSTDEVFTCEKCNKEFTSKSSLRYHVKLHDGKIYTCDKCSKEFNHPGTLRNHTLIHEERKFICDKCGKGFRTNFHLVMHDNQTHRKARSWKCKDCGKAFVRCATHREHMRSHNSRKMEVNPNLQVDIADGMDVLNDTPQPNLDSQTLNESEDLFFNRDCRMLNIEEGINDEANIIVDGETTNNFEENLVVNPEAELYGEEFVINDDGSLMISSLMDVK